MTRIRKTPVMTGTFAEIAQEFIQYKRSLGFKYSDEPKCLCDGIRTCDLLITNQLHYRLCYTSDCNIISHLK